MGKAPADAGGGETRGAVPPAIHPEEMKEKGGAIWGR